MFTNYCYNLQLGSCTLINLGLCALLVTRCVICDRTFCHKCLPNTQFQSCLEIMLKVNWYVWKKDNFHVQHMNNIRWNRLIPPFSVLHNVSLGHNVQVLGRVIYATALKKSLACYIFELDASYVATKINVISLKWHFVHITENVLI